MFPDFSGPDFLKHLEKFPENFSSVFFRKKFPVFSADF